MSSLSSSDQSVHDQFAADYDQQVRAYGWWGHEALFGLCFEYIRPRERLLDVGIGTGLASSLFARAGLQVFGLDSGPQMLELCRAKNIAVDLQLWDVRATPWPYQDGFFDHVIACGVFHFLSDFGPVFAEVSRVLMPGGIFAFTTKAPPAGTHGIIDTTVDGVRIFSHGKPVVDEAIARYGYETLKCLRLAVGCGAEPDSFFSFVARKSG